MALKISKSLKSKLPDPERETIEDELWAKSGGHCFLCEGDINRASDDLEADHDVPEAEGGLTELNNLNLVHAQCNKAKRDSKSVDVRPYLKLKFKAQGQRLKYDGFLPFLGINPKPVVVEQKAPGILRIELPDGRKEDVPVFEETNRSGKFSYVFVSLPREAIFNDQDCQPRNMRLEHAWQIYCDLQQNVLHEPPSCRLENFTLGQPVRLLMFDGQHKTLASWMLDRQNVTAKVYLNLTVEQANVLVNSIQAKIKKLPLSPFELAGKMSDEWENKFKSYESEAGSTDVSESGFLEWLPKQDRARGKDALKSALVQNILGRDDLRIKNFVKTSGVATEIDITEQTLKGKVIEKLLALEPRTEMGQDAQDLREAEADNIVHCLNKFVDLVLEPSDPATGFTAQELERARRMTYQASLNYFAELCRQFWPYIAAKKAGAAMSDSFSDKQMKQLDEGLERLFNHPAWFADFALNEPLAKFKLALEKNQGFPDACEALGLDLTYVVMGKNTQLYKAVWGTK